LRGSAPPPGGRRNRPHPPQPAGTNPDRGRPADCPAPGIRRLSVPPPQRPREPRHRHRHRHGEVGRGVSVRGREWERGEGKEGRGRRRKDTRREDCKGGGWMQRPRRRWARGFRSTLKRSKKSATHIEENEPSPLPLPPEAGAFENGVKGPMQKFVILVLLIKGKVLPRKRSNPCR